MAKLYNFVRLIAKYSVEYTVTIKAKGSYVDGKYQQGVPTESTERGAIVPLAQRKIYQSGGAYTTNDRQLYRTTPITDALEDVTVKYKGNTYNVEEETDYSDYGDVYVYLLKWVSKFD